MHTLMDLPPAQLPPAQLQVPAAAPDDSREIYVQGLLALRNGDAEDAVSLLNRALRRQPNHHGMRRNLVRALLIAERFDQVVIQANAALSGMPDDAELHFARGTALNALGHHARACAAFGRALSLQPNHAPSWLNMGNASADLDDLASAETLYRTATRLDRTLAEAHASLGYILTMQGRLNEAVEACEAAIRLRPDFPQAHWNLAIALLLGGDLPRGFAEYEWRKRHALYRASFPELPGRKWDGTETDGQTILVRAEQGLGDVIQFARYLPLIRDAGGIPVLVCAPSLVPLMQSMTGVQVVASSAPLPAYDAWIDQISLPQVFGTTLATIPGTNSYLSADPARVRAWHHRLLAGSETRTYCDGTNQAGTFQPGTHQAGTHQAGTLQDRAHHNGTHQAGTHQSRAHHNGTHQDGAGQAGGRKAGGRKVGIALAGNPRHPADRRRSIPPDFHVNLPRIPGLSFVSLLHGPTAGGLGLPDLTRWMTDYAETAALIENLDLVVTVDTSVAHLAGALGKPVWILLPHAPDWRWLLSRPDSPWYRSARLFRQPAAGDWTSVLTEVMSQLVSSTQQEQQIAG